MLSIEGFDEDLVETLRGAITRDVLLTAALAGDETREPQDDLLTMEGMTPGLAYQLADPEFAPWKTWPNFPLMN